MNQPSDKSVDTLFKILKCFLYNNSYEENIEKEEFEEICFLAKIHKLEGILYYVIQNQKDRLIKINPQLFNEIKKEYRLSLYNSLNYEECAKEIGTLFSESNIELMFFKGIQIKELYPVPQLRTMGDIDCLIDEKDRDTAHNLMCSNNFECTASEGNVWTYRKDYINIEMHTKIAENSIGNGFDYYNYFSHALSHSYKQDNITYMEKEFNLCYLIYHIAKHLSSTGAGIRMIFDIAVILNHYATQFDMEKAIKLLNDAQLLGTANTVFSLCDKWFGTSFATQITIPNGLEEYIICGGTFGFETHDIGDIYRRKVFENDAKSKGRLYRLKVLKDFFFPSSKYMINFLPALKKHKWLLPIAWIRRWFVGAFQRKKHSVTTLKSIKNGDSQRSYEEAEMLRKMGL